MARTRRPHVATLQPKPPQMSPKLAAIFAKLLHVGCPGLRAVLYCAPELDMDTAKLTLREWMADSQVLKAIENINGGAWIDLPPEERFKLAFDKHISEMAFHLYATNFGEIEHKDGLDKLKQCREVVGSLIGKKVDTSDPMNAFAQFAIELTKTMAEADSRRRKAPELRTGPSESDLLDQMSRVMDTRKDH